MSLQSGDAYRVDGQLGVVGSPVQGRRRSMSFCGSMASRQSNGTANPLEMSSQEMMMPNGFRRSFLLHRKIVKHKGRTDFLRRNFEEFFNLYGHFAGEDLSEDEDDEEDDEGEEEYNEWVIENDEERQQLVVNTGTEGYMSVGRRGKKGGGMDSLSGGSKRKSSTKKAILLLLKSFVGTGVLFLPKGFQNGGWMFSSVSLLFFAVVSYYCFILLIDTKTEVRVDGYGELGAYLFNSTLKNTVLASIVLSQIGFAAAYTVFTATNLQSFFYHVFKYNWSLPIWIVIQLVFYLPLSLTRNIARLSATALLADLFILMGLVYVYYYTSAYLASEGIAYDSIQSFNNVDWTLFIGTAIFTFEGVGLLIPIHESMEKPEHFKPALRGVLVLVTVVFISCGLICYFAFGSEVETVILLNFPSDSIFSNSVQFIYAIAILLSTPLQLFPAIKILENKLFKRHPSGKHNPRVKWLKNYFRCFIVLITALVAWLGAYDLDKFVALIGSFACIPLIYIYPPLFHYKVFQDNKLHRTVDLALLTFGISVMIYTSWQTLLLWFD